MAIPSPSSASGSLRVTRSSSTDPQYLANLAAEAEDLCEGVEGYPCGGYSAEGTPEALSGWTGQLTIPQTYDLGLVHITELGRG